MKKTLAKNLLILFFILSIIAAGGYFLLGTRPGLKTTIIVASHILPGKLQIQNSDGILAGPLKCEKITYQNSKFKVVLGRLELNWNIAELLLNKIHFSKIEVDNLIITTTPTTKSKKIISSAITPFSFQNKLPVKLEVDNLVIKKISWQKNNKNLVTVDEIVLSSNYQNHSNISINSSLKTKNASLKIYGTIGKNWQLTWALKIPQTTQIFPQTSGQIFSSGEIFGAKKNPEITAQLTASSLKYLGYSLTKLNSIFHLNFGAKQPSAIQLNAKDLKYTKYHFDQLQLTGNYVPATKKINFAIKIMEHPPIAIEMQLGNEVLQSNYEKIKLLGKLTWHTSNLAFLTSYIPNSKNLQGNLACTLTTSGTLQDPIVNGNFVLDHGTIELPALAIQPKDIHIEAKSNNLAMNFTMQMTSGKGTLQAQGKVNLSPKKLLSDIAITGNNFLTSNTTEYKIVTNPELQLKYSTDGLALKGKIFIPSASIKPQDFNSDFSLPNEVTFHTAKSPLQLEPQIPDIFSQINLVLGNDINIDIFNLKGKVKGELQIKDEPNRETTAFGNLAIVDGTYNAYGQKLVVTTGNLRFAGPIQNPAITVQAIRKLSTLSSSLTPDSSNSELTVGLRLHGWLNNPQTTLFSEPAGLTKTDILSYLILGQPSNQLSTNNIHLLLNAANALNFSGVGELNRVVDKLKEKLGLTEFGLIEEPQTYKITSPSDQKLSPTPTPFAKNNENLRTTTAFVLGKFLTPKIYISYSMGLIESVKIFRIKYLLSKHLSIQSENSTTGNGADIMFSVEK